MSVINRLASDVVLWRHHWCDEVLTKISVGLVEIRGTSFILEADPRLAMVAITVKGCGLAAIWVQMVLQCTQVPLNHLYPMHPSLSPVTSYIDLHLGGGVSLWILGVGSTGRHLHCPPQEYSQGCHMTLCHPLVLLVMWHSYTVFLWII